MANKHGLKITPWLRSQPNFTRLLTQVIPVENRCHTKLHWTKSNFIETFELESVQGAVAFHGKGVAGYLILYLSVDTTEIINLVVDAPLRRLKIGTSLIDYAAGKAASVGSKRLVANVRETNLDGQLFMKAQGFECVSIDPDYYRNTTADNKWEYEPSYVMMRGSAEAKARARRKSKR